MVTILVGKDLEAFGVHKFLIDAYSPVMAASLAAITGKQRPRIVKLPSEDPTVFSNIIYWLYENRFARVDAYIRSGIDVGLDADPFGVLIEIYALTLRIEMPIVGIDVLYALELVYKATELVPSLKNMNRAWQITRGQPNQALRYMFRDWYVHHVRNPSQTHTLRLILEKNLLNKEVVIDLFCAFYQYAADCECQEGMPQRTWEDYAMIGMGRAVDGPFYPGVTGVFSAASAPPKSEV